MQTTEQTNLFDAIQAHFTTGGIIQVRTYLRATNYTPKHAGMFRAHASGVLVQRGKSWDLVFPQYVFFMRQVVR